MKTIEEKLNHLISNKEVVFEFLREKYPIFFNSNIFLRDIQYGILTYFERKDIMISYPEAEELALKFTAVMEADGDLRRLDTKTWMVNFKFEKPELQTEETVVNSENEKGPENE
jgi:hypothetical protein